MIKQIILCVAVICLLDSCSVFRKKEKYDPTFAPEEASFNVTKITDETKGSVSGPQVGGYFQSNRRGKSSGTGLSWSVGNRLAVSPDGKEIAYLSRMNGVDNILVRQSAAGSSSAATQRTFRNVWDFDWGKDGKLYFSDLIRPYSKICTIDASRGSLMNQLTSNNNDYNPVLSHDETRVFFTRYEGGNDYSIWCYNLKTGELSSCARGFQPEVIPGTNDEFYCVRNTSAGNSEIWHVNYITGKETLIVSDNNRGFTSPSVSPDGKWLLLEADTKSTVNNKKNLDIFVVRTDGGNLTQLTYHPANDMCPKWNHDGSQIYFLSTRANKEGAYNVWRMNFLLK